MLAEHDLRSSKLKLEAYQSRGSGLAIVAGASMFRKEPIGQEMESA